MVLEKITRTITRRTSTFLATAIVGGLFLDHGVFTGCDAIFEHYNKGVSESNLVYYVMPNPVTELN